MAKNYNNYNKGYKSNNNSNYRGKKKSKFSDIEKFAYNLGIATTVVTKKQDSKILDSFSKGTQYSIDKMNNKDQKPKKLFG